LDQALLLAGGFQHEGNVIEHGFPDNEFVILKDDSDFPSEHGNAFVGNGCQIHAVNQNLTPRNGFSTVKKLQKRTFTGTAGSGDKYKFIPIDFETQIHEGLLGAVMLVHMKHSNDKIPAKWVAHGIFFRSSHLQLRLLTFPGGHGWLEQKGFGLTRFVFADKSSYGMRGVLPTVFPDPGLH
jgi:hypothetical protein